jgi:hypothetical protein
MARRINQNASKTYSSRVAESRRERLENELGVKLSKAQLRGKPKNGELPISVLRLSKGSPEQKYDYVARQVYKGRSATEARKDVKLSAAKFREAQKSDPTLKKEKGRYRISSKGIFSFFDRDGNVTSGVRIIGESKRRFHAYEDAYELALSGPTAEDRAKGEKQLRSFAKVKIYDADGKRIYPATNIKIIKKALKSSNADQRARFAERFYEREAA